MNAATATSTATAEVLQMKHGSLKENGSGEPETLEAHWQRVGGIPKCFRLTRGSDSGSTLI